jgi:hypothetical protein
MTNEEHDVNVSIPSEQLDPLLIISVNDAKVEEESPVSKGSAPASGASLSEQSGEKSQPKAPAVAAVAAVTAVTAVAAVAAVAAATTVLACN